MSLIVDASVAVKWVLEEEGSERARALRSAELWAPDLILLEVFNAVHKRVRQRLAQPDQLAPTASALRAVFAGLAETGRLIDQAAALAQEVDHPIDDCVYLALARQDGRILVTADRRLLEAASRARIQAQPL